jgi:hypothetical protein
LLRGRIVRRWALAVAGRYALVALALAVVGAALAALGLIGRDLVVAVPLVLFVAALACRLLRPPSLGQVARLLDDRLGLFDVTATALELEDAGAATREGPAAPVFAEAAALLRAGVTDWRLRLRSGGRELAVGAALVVALVALVAVAGGSGGSRAPEAVAVATPGGGDRAATGPNSVSPPLSAPKAKRNRRGAAVPPGGRRPRGLYQYGFEGKGKLPHFGSNRTGLHYAHGAPKSSSSQGTFAAPAVGEANTAREQAEAEAAKAGATPNGGRREGSSEPSPSLQQLAASGTPPSGSVSPVANSSSGAGPPGSKAQGAATAPSNSPAGGQRAAAGANGRQGGGSPSGSAEAGHQRATLGGDERESEGGRTGAGALPLKAGFAAVHSGKAASGRGPRDAQGGGGPGRSAGIAGSAFEESEAGSLGYVPPDAGVAAGADRGLFARYLNALARIQGVHW